MVTILSLAIFNEVKHKPTLTLNPAMIFLDIYPKVKVHVSIKRL